VDRSDQEYLEALRAHAADTLLYLSDRQKPERERAVCRAFLRCIGLSFYEHEIIAPAPEPTDVSFRDAQFQVREFLEKGRRRGDEWNAKQELWSNARSMDDVVVPWKPPAAMCMPDLMATVTVALEGKAYKYGTAQCRGLDALVYVNLTATRFLHPVNAPSEVSRLQRQGWRSVSLLFPPYGIVACASANAPAFLRSITGQVLNAWSDPQDLFDLLDD
jgi:hypothetical protein